MRETNQKCQIGVPDCVLAPPTACSGNPNVAVSAGSYVVEYAATRSPGSLSGTFIRPGKEACKKQIYEKKRIKC